MSQVQRVRNGQHAVVIGIVQDDGALHQLETLIGNGNIDDRSGLLSQGSGDHGSSISRARTMESAFFIVNHAPLCILDNARQARESRICRCFSILH